MYLNSPDTRTCFYITKKLATTSWNVEYHNPDFQTLRLKTEDLRVIHVYNIYNPGGSTAKDEGPVIELRQWLEIHPQNEHIVAGDFNLHHPAWGGVEVYREERGSDTLLRIVEAHQMEQLLTPGTITYSDKGHSSTIDLVLATPLLTESLIVCQTKSYQFASDHYPIETIFNLNTTAQRTGQLRQFKKTNANILFQAMTQELNSHSSWLARTKEEADQSFEQLLGAINRSIEKAVPIAKICERSMPGFNEECKEAVRRVKRLHKP